MATHESANGSIVHVELYSEDPDATWAFYEDVFGWDFEAVEGGGYTMVRPPTPPNGGVMQASEEVPVGTLPYLLVASTEDTCRAVDASGGGVLREPSRWKDGAPWPSSGPPATSCTRCGKAPRRAGKRRLRRVRPIPKPWAGSRRPSPDPGEG